MGVALYYLAKPIDSVGTEMPLITTGLQCVHHHHANGPPVTLKQGSGVLKKMRMQIAQTRALKTTREDLAKWSACVVVTEAQENWHSAREVLQKSKQLLILFLAA